MIPFTRLPLLASLLAAALALPADSSASHPIAEHPYDHLACYKVSDSKHFRARVTLDSFIKELEIPPSCKVVGRSRAFCAPVRKEVLRLHYLENRRMSPFEMPGHDQSEGRICYRVKCPVEPFVGPLRIQDQFGIRELRDFTLQRLCTNARVLRDDTTTTTTLPDRDPCALIDCAQGFFCRPDCDDPQAADCVALQPEDGICGGFVAPCMEQRCQEGLECLPTPGIPDAPGICVDRNEVDCKSDDDCPDGSVCEPGYPGQLTPSICVPGCHDDADCRAEEQCEQVICVTTPCPGRCVPKSTGECKSDDDCPQGTVCEPAGPFQESSTICVPGCHRDEDCMGPERCLLVDCITTPCPGQCVPIECGDCTSDHDCPDGSKCNADQLCMVSCGCPQCAVCAGNCVGPIE